MKFKDLYGNPHEIEGGFEYLLPSGSVEIDQAEFNLLAAPPTPTAQEIEDNKTNQAEAELGSDAIRIIVETIVPMIQDGSITTAIPADIIATAKAMRKAEL